jgi:ABC-type cobalamin/Fe3+-siderophores transport system ATPase subunit
MIKNFRLRFGRAPQIPAEEVHCTPITVFVGPNNSGKSKVLSELHRYCAAGGTSLNDVVLGHLEFEGFSRDEATRRIAEVTLDPQPSERDYIGYVVVGKRGQRQLALPENLLSALVSPSSNPAEFCGSYLKFHTIFLDGQSRIQLIQNQGAGDLQERPENSFQVLFQDSRRRTELQRIIHEAFGTFLVIDPTRLGVLRLRLSAVPPPSQIVEQGIHQEAVSFHGAAAPIEFASDGVKAFTGIMVEIIAGAPSVLLIDEPEAFLHPGLAFILGREICRAAAGSDRRVFVSTHSPNFVMGCVQSGAPITLIRLTYRNGIPTARVLASADILRLMRNPLLRSTSVLTGLFHESVVVTESDADRAFYQEINERLLRDRPDMGIPNCLFLNAQNKQTVPTIIRPLRELGIAAAGIVDIDVIKDGGATWASATGGAFLPDLEGQAMAQLRAAAKARFDATGCDMKREGGIALLAGTDREAVENLFRRLAEYGLFVVPGGEVESWLKAVGATGHGPAWLVEMFERLGEDPTSASYVHAGVDDVWGFMGSIKEWFGNANRRGIPT